MCIIVPVSECGKLFWFIFEMEMWCSCVCVFVSEQDLGLSVRVHASSFLRSSWEEFGTEVVRVGEVRRFWRWGGWADSGFEMRLDWCVSSHWVSHLPAMKSGCVSMECRIGMLVCMPVI